MNNPRRAPAGGLSLRSVTRLVSVIICSTFLVLTVLVLTNEDKPQGPAIVLLAVLLLTIVACFVAWRAEKAGGALVIGAALILGVTAFVSARMVGLGADSLLAALIYGAPFLLLGVLFWISGQRTA